MKILAMHSFQCATLSEMLTLDQWLAIGGPFIGLLGIFTAYIFYIKGKKEPAPWYSIHPLRVHIVDTGQAEIQGLEIRHNGNLRSDKNITATTVFLGNRGSAALRRNDILEPLVIKFPDESEILEARIVKVSRQLCGFSIEKAQTCPTEVKISFNIAEKFDGAQIQIIHSGAPDASITFTGTFVGCAFLERDYNSIGQSALSKILPSVLQISMAAIAATMMTLAMLSLILEIPSWRLRQMSENYNRLGWATEYSASTLVLLLIFLIMALSFIQRAVSRLQAKNKALELLQRDRPAKV